MINIKTINALHTAVFLGKHEDYHGDVKEDTLAVIEELIELREKIDEAREVLR